MAPDQGPMTDGDIAAAKSELRDLQCDVREALADEFGGEPADYRGDVTTTDGGDT